MAKTRSAAKQARASVRRQVNNKAIKSRLHKLEKKFLSLIEAKQAKEAVATYGELTAGLDKAAKTRVIHRNLADRKKSRMALRFKALAPA